MKNLREIIYLGSFLLITLQLYSCNTTSPEDLTIPFEEIEMEGMDKVSIGGVLEVVIRSQDEYEKLIYERFQKPLDDYWNSNYESVLMLVKEEKPGLTDEEYESLVRQKFYSVLPFRGTENYEHYAIDFSRYTLLGQDAHSGGCELPDYEIQVKRDDQEYIYSITITRKGDCEMGIPKNKWILISKISNRENVKFEKIEIE